MPSLAEMMRRAKMQSKGSVGVRDYNYSPGSSLNVETMDPEEAAAEMGMEPQSAPLRAGVSQDQINQLEQLATSAFGKPPKFQGNTMLLNDGESGSVNLDDNEEVLSFMEFASSGLEPKSEAPDNQIDQLDQLATAAFGKPPKFDGNTMLLNDGQSGSVNLSDPKEVAEFVEFASMGVEDEPAREAVAAGPRRIQMPPMQVQARSEADRSLDMMATRSMEKAKARLAMKRQRGANNRRPATGIASVDLSEISAEESPRTQSKRMANMSERWDGLVEKLGMDPKSMKVPQGADFSTLTPQERWLARQIGVYPGVRSSKRGRGRR